MNITDTWKEPLCGLVIIISSSGILYFFDKFVLKLLMNFFCSSRLFNNSSFLSSLISKCKLNFFFVVNPLIKNCKDVPDSSFSFSSFFSSSFFFSSSSIAVVIPQFSSFLASKPKANNPSFLFSVFTAFSIGTNFSGLVFFSFIISSFKIVPNVAISDSICWVVFKTESGLLYSLNI